MPQRKTAAQCQETAEFGQRLKEKKAGLTTVYAQEACTVADEPMYSGTQLRRPQTRQQHQSLRITITLKLALFRLPPGASFVRQTKEKHISQNYLRLRSPVA